MRHRILVFAVLPLLISCQETENNPNWLLGNWRNTTPTMDGFEIWSMKKPNHLQAESFILVKNDTVFYEHVDLTKTAKGWEYSVSVRSQNREQAVAFTSTHISSDSLVFENKEHEFPNRIVYKKISPDSLVATIFGIQKGKAVSEVFPFKKE